jgi:hypothetical protein
MLKIGFGTWLEKDHLGEWNVMSTMDILAATQGNRDSAGRSRESTS